MKTAKPLSSLTEEDILKLADNMQLQTASFTVTLPTPPADPSYLPGYLQVLLDHVIGIHIALRDTGSDVLGMKAVKFTPSVIDPTSGRGDLELHVIRVKTPQPALNSLN